MQWKEVERGSNINNNQNDKTTKPPSPNEILSSPLLLEIHHLEMSTGLSLRLSTRITGPKEDQLVHPTSPSSDLASFRRRGTHTRFDLASCVGSETAGDSTATNWRTDVIWISRERGGDFGEVGRNGSEVGSVESECHLLDLVISKRSALLARSKDEH